MKIPKTIKGLKEALPGWHVSSNTSNRGKTWIVWCTKPKKQQDKNYWHLDDNPTQVGVKLMNPDKKRKREAIAAAYAAANSIGNKK